MIRNIVSKESWWPAYLLETEHLKMKNRNSRLLFGSLMLSGLAVVLVQSKVNAQEPPPPPSKRSGQPPRATFGALSEEDNALRIRREKRENKHRNFYRPISDPGRLVEGEQTTIKVRIYEYSRDFEPFPAAQAALVIVGTVTRSQGFVSADRTYIYSDFHISVEEILKGDPSAKISIGSTVIASRPGATVDFPSGHTRQFVIEKQGLPKIGSKYLFFLRKAEPDLPEYEIIVSGAYEISEGRAHPLDDYQPKLEGVPALVLMEQARKAVDGAPK